MTLGDPLYGRTQKKKPISYNALFSNSSLALGGQACVFSAFEPFSDTMSKFYKKVKDIDCSKQENWVTVSPDGSRLAVAEKAQSDHGPVTCTWRDVFRDGDFKTFLGAAVSGPSSYDLGKSDYVFVKCRGRDGASWDNVAAGLRPTVVKDVKDVTDGLGLNVVVLGIDSVSRLSAMRNLPRSLAWMEAAGAVTMETFAVLGDGTLASAAAWLTGTMEAELPETRKRIKKADYVDVFPFIFAEFKQKGYVTAYSEDQPYIGAWTYR